MVKVKKPKLAPKLAPSGETKRKPLSDKEKKKNAYKRKVDALHVTVDNLLKKYKGVGDPVVLFSYPSPDQLLISGPDNIVKSCIKYQDQLEAVFFDGKQKASIKKLVKEMSKQPQTNNDIINCHHVSLFDDPEELLQCAVEKIHHRIVQNRQAGTKAWAKGFYRDPKNKPEFWDTEAPFCSTNFREKDKVTGKTVKPLTLKVMKGNIKRWQELTLKKIKSGISYENLLESDEHLLEKIMEKPVEDRQEERIPKENPDKILDEDETHSKEDGCDEAPADVLEKVIKICEAEDYNQGYAFLNAYINVAILFVQHSKLVVQDLRRSIRRCKPPTGYKAYGKTNTLMELLTPDTSEWTAFIAACFGMVKFWEIQNYIKTHKTKLIPDHQTLTEALQRLFQAENGHGSEGLFLASVFDVKLRIFIGKDQTPQIVQPIVLRKGLTVYDILYQDSKWSFLGQNSFIDVDEIPDPITNAVRVCGLDIYSLDTLKQKNAWLHDDVIDAFLTLTKKQHTDVHLVSPIFVQQLCVQLPAELNKVETTYMNLRYTGYNAEVAEATFDRQDQDPRVTIIPACENTHWWIYAFYWSTRTLVHICSLGWESTAITESVQKFLSRFGEVKLIRPSVPRQRNLSDCGVHTIFNGKAVMESKQIPEWETLVDVRFISQKGRDHILQTLLAAAEPKQ